MPDVIFNIVADSSQLESTITLLEKLGQVDKKTAEQFRAATEEYKKSAGIIAQATQAQVGASEKFAAGAKGIDLLSKALKDLGIAIPKEQLKQFAEGVLLGLEDAMLDAGAATKGTVKTLDDLKKVVSGSGGKSFLGATLDQASNITKTNNGLQSLKARLLEAKTEAQKLGVEFGFDSKQAVAAQVAVGKLDGELQEFNERVRSFNPENKFQAVSAAFQGIAGSIAIASGTMTLFGADTEQAEAITKKLDAALKLTAGLSAITQLGGDFKNLGLLLGVLQPQIVKTAAANVVLAESEIAAGAGAEVAAAGTTAFNTALKLSPIGIFLTVLTAAAAAYVLLADSATDAEKAQEKLNTAKSKAIEDSAVERTQLSLLITEYGKANTAQGRRSEIINDLKEQYPSYFGNLDAEKSSVEEVTAAYNKLTEALILKAQADNIIQEIAKNNTALLKNQNKETVSTTGSIFDAIKLAAGGALSAANAIKQQTETTKQLTNENEALKNSYFKINEELQKLGGDPDKKGDKSKTPRATALRKQLEDESKIIEALRKKELAQDIENLKIYVAQRKTQINDSFATEEQKAKELAGLELAELNLRLLYNQQYGEDIGDILNQIADKKRAFDKEFNKPLEVHPNREDFEKSNKEFEDANKAAIDLANQRASIIQEIENIAVQTSFDLFKSGTEARIGLIEQERDAQLDSIDALLNANEVRRNKEIISQTEANRVDKELRDKRTVAELEAQKKINDQKRKADLANRAQKIFEVGIATFRNATEQPGPLGVLIPFWIALGAAQATSILAAPLPKYEKGTLSLQRGKNKAGVDTIPIYANEGEAITPTDKAKAYHDTLKAIHTGSIPANVMNDFAKSYSIKSMPTFSQVSTTNYKPVEIDYDKLGDVIMGKQNEAIYQNKQGHKAIVRAIENANSHVDNIFSNR